MSAIEELENAVQEAVDLIAKIPLEDRSLWWFIESVARAKRLLLMPEAVVDDARRAAGLSYATEAQALESMIDGSLVNVRHACDLIRSIWPVETIDAVA